MWGMDFDRVGRRYAGFVAHHNDEDCDWTELKDILKEKIEPNFPISPAYVKRHTEITHDRIMTYPSSNPADIIPLLDLPALHPARVYALNRGCNPEMIKYWGLCYCKSSEWRVPVYGKKSRSNVPLCYRTPADRLIIPNLQPDGSWFGWQARYIGGYHNSDNIEAWGQAPRDPVSGSELIPKYLTAPGLQKSAIVFNIDRAMDFWGGQVVIVSEGPLSAIATGPMGVCTMGMCPSPLQQRALVEKFNKGTAIFMIEDEARQDGKVLAMLKAMQGGEQFQSGAFGILMPPGEDAASLNLTATALVPYLLKARETGEYLIEYNGKEEN
jgi:hypothetical protein